MSECLWNYELRVECPLMPISLFKDEYRVAVMSSTLFVNGQNKNANRSAELAFVVFELCENR